MSNSMTNPNVPITKQDLADFYQAILPYLGAGVENVSDLVDVTITSLASGQMLKYDSTTSKWVNVTFLDDNSTTSSNTWSAYKINSLISAISGLKYTIVQTLPTTDIQTDTIYLVQKTTSGTNDVYDEYLYINNAWEHIGSTEVDLTNYYTKTQIDSMFTTQSTVDSTQNSQISSLSTSASEMASTASSLSTENSTQNASISSLTSQNSLQTSEISSLSTAESELASEVTVLGSEVAEKQDELVAGNGISIDSNNVISASAKVYADILMPSGS